MGTGSRRDQGAGLQGRLEFLDGVRGVAALVVVLEHALESWLDGYTQWSVDTVNVGRVGIVAFFMVSGYVIGLTLTHQTVRSFAIRRFWRLYPVYWLATTVWVLVDLPRTDPLSAYSLFVVVANLTMLQGALPGVTGILGPAWTLGAELVYYVQTAFSKAVGLLRASVHLGYAWLALFAAMAVSNAVRGSSFTAIVPLMLFFASLGYSLYLRDAVGSRAWIGLMASALVVVPACSVPLLSSQPADLAPWSLVGFNASHVLGIAFFLTFRALRAEPFPRWVLWLGSVSYALYVVHASVIRAVEYLALPGVVAVPVVVVIALGAAWVLHRFVEVPSITRGRRLSQRWSTEGTGGVRPPTRDRSGPAPRAVGDHEPSGAPAGRPAPTAD